MSVCIVAKMRNRTEAAEAVISAVWQMTEMKDVVGGWELEGAESSGTREATRSTLDVRP